MDCLKQYKAYLDQRQYSGHTVIHYINDLQLFQKEMNQPWEATQKKDVDGFIKQQLQQNCTPKTINRRLYVIDGFFHYLQEELGGTTPSPVRKSHFIRERHRLPQTLEDFQIDQFFQVIKDIRDQAIFGLMLRCGLRVGEVADLELQDVNLFNRQLRITGKRKKERIVPISKEMQKLLVQCLRARPQQAPKFFWNKKQPEQALKINSIQRLLKRYAQTAQVELHCHLLRHTFARQMTEQGMNRTVLRDLLGHSSISTTDVYGKLSDPFIKKSYFEAMDRILAENSTEINSK